MIWLGPECLHIGGGVLIVPGDPIPLGAITNERFEEFKSRGKASGTAPKNGKKRKKDKNVKK
jgi:hypothetical protein